MSDGSGRPDRYTIAGFVLGTLGVGILAIMGEQGVLKDRSIDGSLIMGLLLLTGASIAWAAGSLYSRQVSSNTSLQYRIALQAISGGIVLMAAGSLSGEWKNFIFAEVSNVSILALVYLIVFGTIIAYSTYVWLLKVSSPERVGTYAYVNPVIAILLGAILLDEPLNTHVLVGSSFILLAIFLVSKPRKLIEYLRTRIVALKYPGIANSFRSTAHNPQHGISQQGQSC